MSPHTAVPAAHSNRIMLTLEGFVCRHLEVVRDAEAAQAGDARQDGVRPPWCQGRHIGLSGMKLESFAWGCPGRWLGSSLKAECTISLWCAAVVR